MVPVTISGPWYPPAPAHRCTSGFKPPAATMRSKRARSVSLAFSKSASASPNPPGRSANGAAVRAAACVSSSFASFASPSPSPAAASAALAAASASAASSPPAPSAPAGSTFAGGSTFSYRSRTLYSVFAHAARRARLAWGLRVARTSDARRDRALGVSGSSQSHALVSGSPDVASRNSAATVRSGSRSAGSRAAGTGGLLRRLFSEEVCFAARVFLSASRSHARSSM